MKKLFFAVMTTFAITSATMPAAHAGTYPAIAVGEPVPGYDPSPGYPPYPGTGYDDDDEDQISCGEGRQIVREEGYHFVRSLKCYGTSYRYRGLRAGRAWLVRVNSYSGEIVGARPIGQY